MAARKRNVGNVTSAGPSSQENMITKRQKIERDVMSKGSELITMLKENYWKLTSQRIRLIDLIILVCVTIMLLQLTYRILIGTYAFNSFLSGIFSSGGVTIFLVVLRMQLQYPSDFKDITPEKAFSDFLICCFVLFIGTTTFLG